MKVFWANTIRVATPCLIHKDREPVSKMKDGNASGLSGLAPEMVKAAGEAGVDMITDIVNQIIVEGVILAE